MSAPECPSPDVLERIVAGDAMDAAIADHLANCPICREAIKEIEANNAFLDSFVPTLKAAVIDHGAARSTESEHLEDLGLRDTDLLGYRVESVIRTGGQGVVYRAIHLATNRVVAVKMMRDDGPHLQGRRRRFEREIEIAASLRHPNIVMLYGTERLGNGRVAFAMEYVEGVPLDEWAREVIATGGSSPTLRTRLQVFLEICHAIQHAHARGIIHRDLKPSNILVDSTGCAHVLDFGVAKSIHIAGDVSQTGEFVGTIAYAAPEQLDLHGEEVDTRVDVYALGVNLYKTLTGQFPYRADGPLAEVIHEITQVAPRRPSHDCPEIDSELEAILLKSLAKERERRYQTVQSLREDLRRYLADEPVEAKADSAWYLLRKAAHRHRLGAVIALIAIACLLVLATAMTILYDQKREAESEIRAQLRFSDIQRGRTESTAGSAVLGANLLWRAQLDTTVPTQASQFGGAIEPLDSYWALWDHYSRHACVRTTDAGHEVIAASFSPDGQSLATAGADGRLKVWRMPHLRLLREFDHSSAVVAARFSPDGDTLMTVTQDGAASLWSVADGSHRSILAGTAEGPRFAQLSRDGRMAVVAGHDFSTRLAFLDEPLEVYDLDGSIGHIRSNAISDDGEFVALCLDQNSLLKPRSIVRVWSVADRTLIAETTRAHEVLSLLFAPDGKSLYLAGSVSEIERWDFLDSSEPVRAYVGSGQTNQMCWLDDGVHLVTLGVDRVIRLWGSDQQQPLQALSGQTGGFIVIAARRESPALATGSSDGTICLWDIGVKPWRSIGGPDIGPAHSVAFSPDGRTLAYTGNMPDRHGPNVVRVDMPGQVEELAAAMATASSIAFDCDGSLLASASFDGSISLWNVAEGTLKTRLEDHSGAVCCVAFSPIADLLASGGADKVVRLRDLSTDSVRSLQGHSDRITSVTFHPREQMVASGSLDGTVRVWDVATGAPVAIYTPHGGRWVRAVCFSPSGLLIASGGDDNNIVLTDLSSGRHEVLRGHSTHVFTLAFGGSDRVLISGDRAGNLIMWDVEQRRQLIGLEKHADLLMGVAVSPDGMMLASCSAGLSPEVRLWDMGAVRPHIAGNLEYYGHRLAAELSYEPENLQTMRQWAVKVESHP